MNDNPIDLDGRRTAAKRNELEMRRRPANDPPSLLPLEQTRPGSLEEQMLAEPARTGIDVMEKWRFLLERYSTTSGADDERTQKLIRRAIGDMERLIKREKGK